MKDKTKYKGYKDIYDSDYEQFDDDDCGFDIDDDTNGNGDTYDDDDANDNGDYQWDEWEHLIRVVGPGVLLCSLPTLMASHPVYASLQGSAVVHFIVVEQIPK